MAQVGTGKYTYEVIRDFFKSPDGEPFGLISRVVADAQDRIYVFQRRNPPILAIRKIVHRSAPTFAGRLALRFGAILTTMRP